MVFVVWIVLVGLVSVCTCAGLQNITVAVMVAMSGPKRLGYEALAAVNLSLQHINQSPDFAAVRSQGYQFQALVDDVPCDPADAFADMLNIFLRHGKHSSSLVQYSFVGPSCDEVCQPGGRLASYFDVMMISYGCESSIFEDNKSYPTFGRTTATFKDMAAFIGDVITHYGWPRVTLVTVTTPVWQETLSEFERQLTARSITVRRWSLQSADLIQSPEFVEQLLREAKNTKVYILLMYPDAVLQLMRQADLAGLRNRQNAFLAVDFAGTHKRAELFNATFLEGMLDVTFDVQPEGQGYIEFLEYILNTSQISVNPKCSNYEDIVVNTSIFQLYVDFLARLRSVVCHCFLSGRLTYPYGIHPLLISDGMLVVAGVFNLSLSSGTSISRGVNLANFTHSATFKGLFHTIELGPTGTRVARFMLHNIQAGCYVPVARTQPEGSGLQFLQTPVVWPGGSLLAPRGHDPCGWNNELCLSNDTNYIYLGLLASFILLCLVAVAVAVVYFMYRRNLKEVHLLSTDWLKDWDDIKNRVVDPDVAGTIPEVTNSAASLTSQRSDVSGTTVLTWRHSSNKPFLCPVVRMGVEGTWTFKAVRKESVQLTDSVKRELNQVRDFKHPNINLFMGACVNPSHVALMWMYSPKGSLQDVIHSKMLTMERMFQLSFAQDIAKGLAFLHTSVLRVHGRLKSSNIVVDSGLTCKLTDIDMPRFRDGEQDLPETDFNHWFQHVWTAPERLRDPAALATQKADVYAFGIILYEIMFKRQPYVTEEHMRLNTVPDYKEVIMCVKSPDLYAQSQAIAKSSVTLANVSNTERRTSEPALTGSHMTYSVGQGQCSELDGDSTLSLHGSGLEIPKYSDDMISQGIIGSSNMSWNIPQSENMNSQSHDSDRTQTNDGSRQYSMRTALTQSASSLKHPPTNALSMDKKQPRVTHIYDTKRSDYKLVQSQTSNPVDASLGKDAPTDIINIHGAQVFDAHLPKKYERVPEITESVECNTKAVSSAQGVSQRQPLSKHARVLLQLDTQDQHSRLQTTNFSDSLSGPVDPVLGVGHQRSSEEASLDTSNTRGYTIPARIRRAMPSRENTKVGATRLRKTGYHGMNVEASHHTDSIHAKKTILDRKYGMLHQLSHKDGMLTISVHKVLRPEICSNRHLSTSVKSRSCSYTWTPSTTKSAETAYIHDCAPGEIVAGIQPRDVSTDNPYTGELQVLQLMRRCWAEDPDLRPTSDVILRQLRDFTSGRSLSDNIDQIMGRYSEQLENTVHERTKRLEEEKAKYLRVLCEVIPQKYVRALVSGRKVEAESFSNVSIFFSDIVGFTNICSRCSPREVLGFLNNLYTRFDDALNSYRVYKVETIGDAYMVAAGIPEPISDHAKELAHMALHLLSTSVQVKAPYVDEHGQRTEEHLRLRIGLNSGPVVAGIVGEKMPRYCLFGNTVNMASRMESNGKPLRIHMSKDFTRELEAIGGFHISYRGMISIKGADNPVPTFWLLNSKLMPFTLPVWEHDDNE